MSEGKRVHCYEQTHRRTINCVRARAPVAVVARFWLGGRQRHRIVHHVFLRACETNTRRTQALPTAPDRSSAQCSSASSRRGMRRSAGSDRTSLLGHRLHLQVRILHPRLHVRSKSWCRPCAAMQDRTQSTISRLTLACARLPVRCWPKPAACGQAAKRRRRRNTQRTARGLLWPLKPTNLQHVHQQRPGEHDGRELGLVAQRACSEQRCQHRRLHVAWPAGAVLR